MPIDDRTTNLSYQLPNAANTLLEDVARLRAALAAIDADVFARYTKTEVDTLITNLIAGAPGALNTLDELAAALGDDANFAATVTVALGNRYTKTESDNRYLSSTDASVTTSKLADGALAASTAGLAKMADGFFSATTAALAKFADGFLAASTAGRAKMADLFITTAKLADGVLSADAAGRAKMDDGFITRAKTGESLINLGTLQDTTSQVFRDFTGIPSWARRVVLLFNGVSTTGTSDLLIQLGVSTTPTTSGYLNGLSFFVYASGIPSTTSTAGIPIFNNSALYAWTGRAVIERLNPNSNDWVVTVTLTNTQLTPSSVVSSGVAVLSGALGMVRLTTASGTPTFDAGSLNISWE